MYDIIFFKKECKKFSHLILEFEKLYLDNFGHSYLSHNTLNSKTIWVLIKKNNDELVGGITFTTQGYINHLIVAKKFRNTGVGQWLMNIVLSELEDSSNIPRLLMNRPIDISEIDKCIKCMIFYRTFGFKIIEITTTHIVFLKF